MLYYSRMLTKTDFSKLEKIFLTKNEFKKLSSNFVTKNEFYSMEGKFNQVMNMLDAVMGELKAIREEQTIMFHRSSQNGQRLEDHEGRIKIIESGLNASK